MAAEDTTSGDYSNVASSKSESGKRIRRRSCFDEAPPSLMRNSATIECSSIKEERGGSEGTNSAEAPSLTRIQFQMLLLSPANRALCPRKSAAAPDEHSLPMTHYWVSCSHNSFLEGDQIASTSSEHMYTRLLLQGCRSLEIGAPVHNSNTCHGPQRNRRGDLSHANRDVRNRTNRPSDCWDGEDSEPDVTHGFTLCTRVKFQQVNRRLRECLASSRCRLT